MSSTKSNSCLETEQLGEKLANKLNGNEIIALYGDLGAGKTALTRGICKGLDVKNSVSSPTYAIVNEYSGKFTVYHFDMYRVKSIDDLYSTGYFDYIDNGILIIEWSENIDSILPENVIKINISYGKKENERIIQIEGIENI